MWSIKVEVLLVILVGQSISWLRPYIEQNSLYLLILGNNFLSRFLISFDLLKCICLERVNLYYNSKFRYLGRVPQVFKCFLRLTSDIVLNSLNIGTSSEMFVSTEYLSVPIKVRFYCKIDFPLVKAKSKCHIVSRSMVW